MLSQASYDWRNRLTINKIVFPTRTNYEKCASVVLQRKRGRPAGSKPAKRKMEQKRARKPALVDDIHNSDLTGDTETKVKFPGEYPSSQLHHREVSYV